MRLKHEILAGQPTPGPCEFTDTAAFIAANGRGQAHLLRFCAAVRHLYGRYTAK